MLIEFDELHTYLSYAIVIGTSTAETLDPPSIDSIEIGNSAAAIDVAGVSIESDDKKNDGEKFFDPVTGEQISKNAYKKLQKGVVPKKEKKEKSAAAPKADPEKQKEKKKVKEPEPIYVDATPVGEKKILDGIFPIAYQPKYVESAWPSWWEKSGFYKPDLTRALAATQEEKFVMVIPPPNVTGQLHLGHALTTTIEDTITRYNRMKGKVTLWLPGTDHAGIATQSVVEKRLKKELGLTRHDMGREEFVNRVWQWKNTYGNKITNQIRSLGASVDWSREAFTMDANLSRAVTEAFVRFHAAGLIYRSYITVSAQPQGARKIRVRTITSFAYKVVDSEEEIVVATTRLETMLGDTAVAVHPDDRRYAHLRGKLLQHPFLHRQIPIIADGELVDMSFGTGAVKVTPAHDPNDYNCGKRHNLAFIVVLTEDGKIANNGGEFAGMMRYDARLAMEERLKELQLFRGKEPNKMRLGICSRSGDVVEPMLTPQWYVNCSSMAARAVEAVRSKALRLIPDMYEAVWYRWLENIRDWCISRQLWWGHRIPAYFVQFKGEPPGDKNDPLLAHRWFVARTTKEALSGSAAALGVREDSIELEQDEDVLDTWFSSGLFPFSVFGWPEKTADFDAFYPTSLLETGQDILFFWVARMVMMALQLTDKLPFTTVYLHSMVRDKYGRKMSKSVGNVVDPLEVINGCSLDDLLRKIDEGNLPAKEVAKAKEAQAADFPEGISECGADALRFGLLAYTCQGKDINLDIKRVVGYRQFCNKLWNAVRFALAYLTDFVPAPNMHMEVLNSPHISKRDLFIFSKLNEVIRECNNYIRSYSFGAASSVLHYFFMYDVCDVYLELIKPVVQSAVNIADAAELAAIVAAEEGYEEEMPDPEEAKPRDAAAIARRRCAQVTLFTVLEQYLRLCHPMMPFVTEELWQRLPGLSAFTTVPSIMVSPYPEEVLKWARPLIEAEMAIVKEAVHSARSLRSDYNIANNVRGEFFFRSDSKDVMAALTNQADDFCTLAKASSLKYLDPTSSAPNGCCLKVSSSISLTLLLNLTGIVDIDKELQRLNREVERLGPLIEQYNRKMAAPGYEDKVPLEVRETNAHKLRSYTAELKTTLQAIEAFESMRN